MKKILVLAVLAVVLVATPVMAKEGVYLGGSLGINTITGSDLDDNYEPSLGIEARVGYNFGKVALEGEFLYADQAGDGGFVDADFNGMSLNLRVYLSPIDNPGQVYLLGGLGLYEFGDFSGDLEGMGFNLGVGFEHFFNEQTALDINGIYRMIDYDEFSGSSIPDVSGDALTLGVGVNFYF